jgi:hypothetical protein
MSMPWIENCSSRCTASPRKIKPKILILAELKTSRIESNNQQLWGRSQRRDPSWRSWRARGRSPGGGGRRRRCWRWSGPERDLTSACLVNNQTVLRRRAIAGEDARRRAGDSDAAQDASSGTWARRGNWWALKGTPGAFCWRTGPRR